VVTGLCLKELLDHDDGFGDYSLNKKVGVIKTLTNCEESTGKETKMVNYIKRE
jgi:hypothetical protein